MVRTGGFADEADGHLLALGLHPVQQRGGPIDGVAFLVAGDRQHHGAVRRCRGDEIHGRRREGRDTRLHVRRAAAVHQAALDLGPEGIVLPGLAPTDRDDVGVAVEAEGLRRALRAPPRIEVGDPAAVHPRALEPRAGQHLLQQDQRAALLGRDRGAADKAGGQVDGIGHGGGPRFGIGTWLPRPFRLGKCGVFASAATVAVRTDRKNRFAPLRLPC